MKVGMKYKKPMISKLTKKKAAEMLMEIKSDLFWKRAFVIAGIPLLKSEREQIKNHIGVLEILNKYEKRFIKD